jgi:serine/threonine protein kinase
VDVKPEAVLGRTLGRYTVQSVVGSGLFGTVYRAWDPHYRANRALKALHRVPERDRAMHERLWRDILTAAQVRHAKIVPVFDVFEADGVLCVAMELVQGTNLRERLRGGGMTGSDTSRIVRDAAEGLDAAISAGVLHRDLKPANVLLRESDGAALLTDFGLVWSYVDGTVVGPGPVADSIPYWAPEHYQRGLEVDWRADVYGLAALAYEMLTGRPPARPPDPARRLNPALPARVDEVLALGLSRDRTERPDWPGTLAEQLADALTDDPTVAVDALPRSPSFSPPPSGPTPRRGDSAATVVPVSAATTYVPQVSTPVAPTPASPTPASRPASPPARPRRRLRWAWLAALVLALVATLGGAGLALAHYAAPSPDTRPADVSDDMLLKAVDNQLQACATGSLSGGIASFNCPQQGDHYDQGLSTWELKGLPTANATIHYRGKGVFTVNGRFVMVMRSTDNTTNFPQVDAGAYLAFVNWAAGHLQVEDIRRVNYGPKVPRPAEATDQKAQIALSTLWPECAPKRNGGFADCPSGLLETCGRVTKQYQLVIDQGGAPSSVYDDVRGILKVSGRYQDTETATSTTPGCPPVQTGTEKGTYSIWLVWGGTFFDVVNGVYRADRAS